MVRASGVYIPEQSGGPPPITAVATANTAFIGSFRRGPIGRPVPVTSWAEAISHFGDPLADSDTGHALRNFFLNGGQRAFVLRMGDNGPDGSACAPITPESLGAALSALKEIAPEVLNLLCLPEIAQLGDRHPALAAQLYHAAHDFCRTQDALLIMDTPPGLNHRDLGAWMALLGGDIAGNSAIYHPRLIGPDPLDPAQQRSFAASGVAAGIMARIDAQRGVWAAPAGLATGLAGLVPAETISAADQRPLNDLGINAIRHFPTRGTMIWGARMPAPAAVHDREWRYISVRRFSLHIRQSLMRGLQWAVSEQNAEPLWAVIRAQLADFMHEFHRQGAFPGSHAEQAFFVQCGRQTMTQADISQGRMIVVVGIAPMRPAEFVTIRIALNMRQGG